MNKLFIILALIGVFAIPTLSYGQVSCRPVTADNYSFCCGTAAGNTNSLDCKAYQGGYATPPTSNTTTPSSTAPVGTQCNQIYSVNYGSCCGTFRSQNVEKCVVYDQGYYAPGTVGSGAGPSTGVINNSGGGTQAGSQIANTPQSGSPQLSSCSAIQFLSLLDILIWGKCIIVVAIIPIIFALALLFFLWGVMKFIGASDSTKKEEGKKFIVAGLIGLFVMTSLWGIIKILGTTLGIESTVPLLQTTYLKK